MQITSNWQGGCQKPPRDDCASLHESAIHETVIWQMRSRISFVVIHYSNKPFIDEYSNFVVANKYPIWSHHLAEEDLSFQKHPTFPKSYEWARRYSNPRNHFFFDKKKVISGRFLRKALTSLKPSSRTGTQPVFFFQKKRRIARIRISPSSFVRFSKFLKF